jgi:hypothetical protein
VSCRFDGFPELARRHDSPFISPIEDCYTAHERSELGDGRSSIINKKKEIGAAGVFRLFRQPYRLVRSAN